MNREIIDIALQNLNTIAGIRGRWLSRGKPGGALEIQLHVQTLTFQVEVKHELRAYQLPQLEAQVRQHKHLLLIANRLFPKIKAELRQKEIPYLEANGNIFIKREGLLLFIDTQKPLVVEKTKGNRAFTKTGLKVVFHLLRYKEAIHLPQREIAEATQVALGNIPQVMDGLQQTGYLLPLNNKTYVWENRKALLDRWITDYAAILRPKLLKAQYAYKGNWQELQLDNRKTVWGGEPAADILTDHLRPEKFLIYTRESRMELIKNYKFMPDTQGNIEVLEMFWQHDGTQTAPPLLVYAELMLEGGKRNTETAAKIYDAYIRPNL